jgi:hypothetical protein
MAHPLARVFDEAVHGRFPEPNGAVEVVGAPADGPCALVTFTARTFVALDVDPGEVARRIDPNNLSASVAPPFLQWLADASGNTRVGTHDAVFSTLAVGGEPTSALEPIDTLAHPRVERAARHRKDVRIYVTPDESGVVVLGRGLTRRWEVAFEVDEAARDRGLGTRIAAAARTLLPAGTPLWMQVAPGNARSMRAVYAAGFRPVGSEVLFVAP